MTVARPPSGAGGFDLLAAGVSSRVGVESGPARWGVSFARSSTGAGAKMRSVIHCSGCCGRILAVDSEASADAGKSSALSCTGEMITVP